MFTRFLGCESFHFYLLFLLARQHNPKFGSCNHVKRKNAANLTVLPFPFYVIATAEFRIIDFLKIEQEGTYDEKNGCCCCVMYER